MAAFNWGIEALMLGSLTMLASGVFASSPSSLNASPIRCDSDKCSGKLAIILPANEMSLVSNSMPEELYMLLQWVKMIVY